jgi:homoserine acetyltransferase
MSPGTDKKGTLSAGPSPAAYTDAVRALCERLGITRVAAVVGISGGGPTAVAMAANHPDLVERAWCRSCSPACSRRPTEALARVFLKDGPGHATYRSVSMAASGCAARRRHDGGWRDPRSARPAGQ